MSNQKISALAIVYNEEHNIRDYLNNMSFADEIIVVDSFSTDRTATIIQEEYPQVQFYQRRFDDFSSQRNFTIAFAKHDWIIFFDADERVTKKGIAEIVKTVNSSPEEVAFWVKRIFYYKGRPLVNKNFDTDKAIRLFRKSKCRYSEKLVHETLDIDGKTATLKESIHHYSFKSKEEFLNKRLQYSYLKAKEFHQKGIRTNLYHLTVRPAFRFFKYYVLGLGFLNGQRGLEIAKILGYHVYMRYIYLREMYEQKDNPKILVIQHKMLGDVLASSILCNNLKKMYPNPQVDYMIYPFTVPVVENNPNIDNLVLFEQKYKDSKIEFMKLAFDIRKKKYDIVIDAYGILGSNIIVGLSKAKKRIGFYKPYTSFVYTDTVKELKKPVSNAGLALDNRLLLLKVLRPQVPLDNKPKIFITEEEIANGRTILQNNGIAADCRVYMVSVVGSTAIKTYPAAYMARVLDTIAANDNSCILFNYIPSQHQEAQEIFNLCADATKEKIRMEIALGGIRDFLSVLYHCTALIGNEGGSVNMAKALDIPTFTIFSPWIVKEAWNSFEDGVHNVSVHLIDYKPELYGGASPKEMKPKALELYREFTPDLFLPLLKKYMDAN